MVMGQSGCSGVMGQVASSLAEGGQLRLALNMAQVRAGVGVEGGKGGQSVMYIM